MRFAAFRVALCLGLSVLGALAQQERASVFGIVTDSSGASVAGATVTILNLGTGAAFVAQTSEEGFYSAPGVALGQYQVSVEKPGFKKAVRTGLTLQVDQRAQVNLTLEIGAVAETVEVVGQAPLVDTGNATVGKVIENRRVQELPVNGRNALSLVVLAPAVKSNGGTTNVGFADRGPLLSSISINGGPSVMNHMLLDGANNSQLFQGEVNINLAVDAVQEFKVQTGVMSSEFGFHAGGVVNIVTKSGTNNIHGTAYHFFRNDRLDARNAFARLKPPLRFNQYGASAGGPIVRNRTFYFGNWERYNYYKGNPLVTSVPIQPWREGDFRTLPGISILAPGTKTVYTHSAFLRASVVA
ncbi:MAG: hypothetical protein FJW37_02340 [Acidobacteria bacterium]|nr:hypothetical protein [Acidobacteriota bacterium]